MALASRLSAVGSPSQEPEDFFGQALGIVFTDDVLTNHGDATRDLLYTSPHLPEPLQLRLSDPSADSHDLFSHALWNASLLLAELIETSTLRLPRPCPRPDDFDVTGRAILELGAGSAVPSLMAALLGARHVVATDYPAPEVLATLRHNVAVNATPEHAPRGCVAAVTVEGHCWGELATTFARAQRHAFDCVLAADCLWMPWQHENLRRSMGHFLSMDADARVLLVAGFHTGRARMAGFFDHEFLGEEGLMVESLWEKEYDGDTRVWKTDRGHESEGQRNRWLAVAVLRRKLRDRPGV